MSKKRRERIKGWIVNLFGALAYCAITLQLLVAFFAYFEPLKSLIELTMPKSMGDQLPPSDPLPITEPSEPSIFMLILGFVVVAVMVAITIYAIIKTPGAIARTGKKIIDKTAEASAPIALKVSGKKDNKRNRKKLSPVIKLVLKILLVLIPLLATLFSFGVEQTRIDHALIQAFAIFLAGISLTMLTMQYGLASLIDVKKDNLW